MSKVIASSPFDFRRRLRGGDLLVGTFVKTPHPTVVEVMGHSGLDCVCLDAEHAPFDRAALDGALLAARVTGLPALVRIVRSEPTEVLGALDLGAVGVLVPHVTSADQAMLISRAARYGPGGLGYAGSTRAAGYTTRAMSEIIARGNESAVVIAQIEDEAALGALDAILAVEGIDALFIGVMDLTVSLGAGAPSEPKVLDAVRTIITAARGASRPVGMFASDAQEARRWRREGVSLFLLGSDQQWILQTARGLRSSVERE